MGGGRERERGGGLGWVVIGSLERLDDHDVMMVFHSTYSYVPYTALHYIQTLIVARARFPMWSRSSHRSMKQFIVLLLFLGSPLLLVYSWQREWKALECIAGKRAGLRSLRRLDASTRRLLRLLACLFTSPRFLSVVDIDWKQITPQFGLFFLLFFCFVFVFGLYIVRWYACMPYSCFYKVLTRTVQVDT